jgi:hypothetical protein
MSTINLSLQEDFMGDSPRLPKAKKGAQVELLQNLPESDFPLVTAGVLGTVQRIAGSLFSKRKKYTLVFDMGGPHKPLVVLRNVLREQFRPVKPKK